MTLQKPIKALWLENLGPRCALSSPEAIVAALEFAKQHSFSDIYLQIYREGRAWFPSRVAGQEHFEAAAGNGYRPLETALTQAARLGLRVHGWFNAFNLGLNAGATFLIERGEGNLLCDNRGVSLARYTDSGIPPDTRADVFSMDAPRLWLDPSSPEVRDYFVRVVDEALHEAPGLAGVHLDFFRFPYFLPLQPSSRIACGYEFGYGRETQTRFETQTSLPGAFVQDALGTLRPRDAEVSLRFDQWRRDSITEYLRVLRSKIGSRILSVACLAWPERAYFTAFQNWRAWLEEELVDQACLMAYTADDEHFRYLVKQATAFQTKKSHVLAGVGTYLHKDSARTWRQCQVAEQLGAAGSVVFSYENLRKFETAL